MTKQIIVEDELIEDEISIGDVLSKLWHRRGVILAITLLSIGIALTYILLAATTKRTPVTLFVELTSIKDEKYPNGAKFSPLDLKSPDVLSELVKKYKPKDQEKFNEAISINYGSDLMLGTHESYKQQLAQKGLSSADLQKINSDYKTALDEVARRGLEIRFDYQMAALSKEEGKSVTSDIPKLWNDVYIKKYRVLLDPKIPQIPNTKKTIGLDSATDLLEISENINSILTGLKVLTSDNRFSTLKNPDGSTPFEVMKDLEFFKNVQLLPMMGASITKDDPSAQAYAQSIQIEIEALDRNIASLNELIQQVINYQRNASNASQDKTQNTGENLQLSDNTLSEILKLSNQAALSDFLKDTLNNKRELAFKRSELVSELDRLTGSKPNNFTDEFKAKSAKNLASILSRYGTLIDQVRSSASFSSQSFYTPMGSPESFESKWPDRSLLILALAAIMGLVIASAVALMTPAKHHRYLVNK